MSTHFANSHANATATSTKVLVAVALCLIMLPAVRTQVGGLTVLPEHLAIPILLLAKMREMPVVKPAVRAPFAHSIVLLLIVFWWLFTLVAGIFVAPDPLQSTRLMVWISANIILAALFYSVREVVSQVLHPVLSVFIWSMVVALVGWAAATFSGISNIFVEQDYASDSYRVQALFDEPNLYAGFLVLLAAALYPHRNAIRASSIWVLLALGTVSVYLTFTRAAWIAWGLVVALYAAALIRQSRAAMLATPLAGVFASIALLGTLSQATFSAEDPIVGATMRRLGGFFDLEQGTGFTRALTIQSALDDLTGMAAWWTGLGFNSYPQVHDAGVTNYAAAYLPTLWISIFYDGGIFAGVCFIAAFVVLWTTSGRDAWLFFLSFAMVAATTNNVWFSFPWVLCVVAITRPGALATRGTDAQRDDPTIRIPPSRQVLAKGAR